MIIQIIGILIGIAILIAGIYYLIKEKEDAESKKIYTVISVIGAVLVVVMVIWLIAVM